MKRKPRLASREFGKGSAARQDAIRKGKTAAYKARLDELNARLAEEPRLSQRCRRCNGLGYTAESYPADCPACRGKGEWPIGEEER